MNLKAKFELNRDQFHLDIDLLLPAKGISAVIGHSGCGKTTLLRCIAGLEKCKHGFVTVNNRIWQDDNEFLPIHRRSIGFVFQESGLFPHLTVRGNLEYGYKRLSDEDRKLAFDDVVVFAGLEKLLDRRISTLSGGEQQRVAIARAVLTSPDLLLLDEPFASLDFNSKSQLYDFIARLNQELYVPVLLVSHSHDDVVRLADYLLIMKEGKIVAKGNVQELFTRLDLPLAHEFSAESIIEADVTAFDESFQLTQVKFSGGEIYVPGKQVESTRAVRLRIFARDVSLTLERQPDTSILNIFPAVVEEIMEQNVSQCLVKLTAGSDAILARVTRKSVESLKLGIGKQVFVQIKSVALIS